MIGFYAICAVLVLIAAALIQGAVETAGFWGALAMAAVFAALMATVATNCPS